MPLVCISGSTSTRKIDMLFFKFTISFLLASQLILDGMKVVLLLGSSQHDPNDLCAGHYETDVNTLVQLHEQGKAIRALPPSSIRSDALT